MTFLTNHTLTYPVVRGGIRVHNPRSTTDGGTYGTVGFIGVDDAGQRWLVSCYHVLCRMSGGFPPRNAEPIYHPNSLSGLGPIGSVSEEKVDEALDCAAARLLVPCEPTILGVGKIGQPADAKIGMRVIKSGAATGVTEGYIVNVGADIEIAPLSHVVGYDLSGGGDSGALWIDAETMSPVALHYYGNDSNGPERALGKPIKEVLAKLGLTFA